MNLDERVGFMNTFEYRKSMSDNNKWFENSLHMDHELMSKTVRQGTMEEVPEEEETLGAT